MEKDQQGRQSSRGKDDDQHDVPRPNEKNHTFDLVPANEDISRTSDRDWVLHSCMSAALPPVHEHKWESETMM